MSAQWCWTAWNIPIGLAELLSHFRVFDGSVERSLHSANHLRYQRGCGDIKRLRQGGGFVDLFGGRIFKVHGVKFASQVHSGHGRDPHARALASTTKTPFRATTTMKLATAASVTNNLSPESFPFAAVSFTSARSQLAEASSTASVERASPAQTGARKFLLVFRRSKRHQSLSPASRNS